MNSVSAIAQHLYNNDLFSQWLGIEILECKPGYCQLKMIVRKEMCNGFGIAHGGIPFSLADSALAFASNAQGKKSLSVENAISYLKPIMAGDVLMATAEERHLSKHFGRYDVSIKKEEATVVAFFKGTVYLKAEE